MTRCDENCYPLRPHGKAEHCTVAGCHLTFAGSTTGDAHRTGSHGVYQGPDRRRCRSADELTALGLWTTGTGRMTIWHGEPNKAGVQKHWKGPNPLDGGAKPGAGA
jgi:hypothetical protein